MAELAYLLSGWGAQRAGRRKGQQGPKHQLAKYECVVIITISMVSGIHTDKHTVHQPAYQTKPAMRISKKNQKNKINRIMF